MKTGWVFALVLVSAVLNSQVKAEEEAGEGDRTEQAPPKKVKVRNRAKGKSEKETEGTEAKNRFQADTVLKSQYKLNGDTLEVDPD